MISNANKKHLLFQNVPNNCHELQYGMHYIFFEDQISENEKKKIKKTRVKSDELILEMLTMQWNIDFVLTQKKYKDSLI